MNREPSIIWGAIAALIAALIVLARTMGLPVSAETEDALNKVVAIGLPLILAFVIRQSVYAPATVDRVTGEAWIAGAQHLPKPDLAAPPAV